MHSSPRRTRGYTLIETCSTLAIAAVLAGTAAPNMQEMLQARRFDNVNAALASDIHLARTASILRNQAVRLTVLPRAAGSCYVIHTGSANACACSADDEAPATCQGSAREIKTVALGESDHVRITANVASVVFDPLHGTVTPTGTLRVVGGDGREVRHIVNVMGRARTCTPTQLSGFRAC